MTFAETREARLDFLVLVPGCLLVSGYKLWARKSMPYSEE